MITIYKNAGSLRHTEIGYIRSGLPRRTAWRLAKALLSPLPPALLPILLLVLLAAGLDPAAATCVTDQCHTRMADPERIHPGELDCQECHASPADEPLPPHPAPGQPSFVPQANELCLGCHDDLKLQGYLHPPVAAGDCTACHSPHAENPALLRQPRQMDLCLSCHPGIVTETMTELHGPIARGDCTACHPPHASPHAGLLLKEFPTEPFVSYDDRKFELCFSCHSRELLLFPDTSFATGFRDGERNLHHLHVNRASRGRNCYMCHAIHGGNRAGLVADTVPFGTWDLPLNYQKSATGGTCTPGCHAPARYDRQKPLEPLPDQFK